MQTIRRLYLYGVTFVSAEVILWGSIGLLRSVFAGGELGGGASRLAGAISLILVGIPVFLLHWWLAQRGALRDIEERSARLRAIFLYGILAATLVAALQNFLALLNRWLLAVFGLDPGYAMIGGDQSLADNLIACGINLLAAAYFYLILRRDWRAAPQAEARISSLVGDDFTEVRRLYRYLWFIYAVVMVAFGIQQTLQFVIELGKTAGIGLRSELANGLTLLILGAPLWVFTSWVIRNSLTESGERQPLLRLVFFYLLVFVSVGSVLTSVGKVLEVLLKATLGGKLMISLLVAEVSQPVSVAVAFGVIWVYYGRMLLSEIKTFPDPTRQASFRRLYLYVLALAGLGATFVGLQMLLGFVIDLTSILGELASRSRLATAVSTLVVGLPLWILTWRPIAMEAAKEGEVGDHSRRSVLRKAYLFIVLFAGVMGVMFGAGVFFYQLLRAALGEVPANLQSQVLQQFRILLLFALLLAYAWNILRVDGKRAERSLARRHAQFPVLVLAPDVGNGGPYGNFAETFVNALQRQAPAMPVAVHSTSLGAPDETLSAACAVILLAELLAKPPEAIRLWLQAFSGPRLVVPIPAKGWYWISGSGRQLTALARQTARAIRQLAEGQEISSPRDASPGMVVVYILAGLFTLVLLMAIANVVFSSLIQ